MDQPPLPSFEQSGHLPLTPVQSMLAAEFVDISLTSGPQAATRGASLTSPTSHQPRGQGPGSLAGQVRRQNEHAAQVAFYSQRAISIFSRNPETAGVDRISLESYPGARNVFQEINQGDARRIQSPRGTQYQSRPVFPAAGRVHQDEHNERMWLRLRLELLQLEVGLATEFSSCVKLWIREVVQGWYEQQSQKDKEI